jgi:hypothetical protein
MGALELGMTEHKEGASTLEDIAWPAFKMDCCISLDTPCTYHSIS